MTVGAVAAPKATGFVATVQAAYNGSRVQWAVNGVWSVLGTVFSTLFAHKWKTLGVVGLVALAYTYQDDIKAIARALWIKACASEKKPEADAGRKQSSSVSSATTATAAGGGAGNDQKDVKGSL
jgi:hypothetical protein